MIKEISDAELEERLKSSFTYKTQAPESIGAMLDFEYVSCDAKNAEGVLSHTVSEPEVNIYGTLHGGIISWLMDTAMGIFARAYTGYETIVTLDIHVNFLRPVYAGDKIFIKAGVTHAGSKVVNSISEMYVKDRIVATADSAFYKLD